MDKKYEADELFIKTIAQSYLDYDGRCLCHYLHWCFVRHAKASLAYGSWPLPFNNLVPHTEQDWVQFAHRGMAFITFVDYDYIYSCHQKLF